MGGSVGVISSSSTGFKALSLPPSSPLSIPPSLLHRSHHSLSHFLSSLPLSFFLHHHLSDPQCFAVLRCLLSLSHTQWVLCCRRRWWRGGGRGERRGGLGSPAHKTLLCCHWLEWRSSSRRWPMAAELLTHRLHLQSCMRARTDGAEGERGEERGGGKTDQGWKEM